MSIKHAEEDIQKGTFRPVYLIYGPEAFLRQKLKQAFRNALAGQDELNYTYREGAGTEEDEIRMLAGTIPFMADKRLILL
ncbi:MAG: DNA polymerase III subunit delta, partial [Lachnospiraceae bacterium]|nr:DNA polymerase III subunit delta [Lachnospiraceae bacterium]